MARSGRVPWLSQFSEPTSCRIVSCSFCFSDLEGLEFMIESTGLPERYGVRTGFEDSDSLAMSTKWSA